MRPTTAHDDDNVFDLNTLLHPGTVFQHPKDVVSNPSLSKSEKRAILASWASDAAAVTSNPVLRALPGMPVVTLDEILQALSSLDRPPPRDPPPGKPARQVPPVQLDAAA